MKVALLTIWHEKNYGAELQAYATIKILQQLGLDVELVDIRLSDRSKLNFKGKVGDFISKLGPGNRKFTNFWKTYIPTTKRYRCLEELQNNPPKADIYMVGSDQVWNPSLTREFATVFFLNFGTVGTKRVSYASSFGVSEWTFPELTPVVQKLLDQFDFITCREESGLTILKNVFGKQATNVLDPTLLLNDYSALTGPIKEKNTLVYYPLHIDPELQNYALKLSRKLGLEPINNKQSCSVLNVIAWDNVAVEDWVKNIAESKFVITRSFHGMVFSILYRKQFAVLQGNGKVSTRVLNLLSKLNLQSRYYESIESLDAAEPWNVKIDYTETVKRLDNLRNSSLEQLRLMLGTKLN